MRPGIGHNRPASLSNAERQARFAARMAEQGFVQVKVWAPIAAKADIERAAELIRATPTLTVARLVNTISGKLVSLKRGAKQ